MKALPVAAALALLATSALSAEKLAPPRKVQEMLGDVGVMAKAGDDRCTIALHEDAVPQGYRLTFFEDGGKCAKAYPVMAKVVAWRVYGDGRMAFADKSGQDLITFKKGKGFKRHAMTKVDGVAYLRSAQEDAE